MAKTGRNDLCPCGSGKKYKKCHERGDRGEAATNRILMIVVGAAVAAAIVAGVASFTGTRRPAASACGTPATAIITTRTA